MADMIGVLGRIPGLAGYLSGQQLGRQEDAAQIGQASELMRMLGAKQQWEQRAQAAQREQQFRSGLRPDMTEDEMLRYSQGFIRDPKDLAGMIQQRQLKQEQINNTKQIALNNLMQKVATESRHAYEFAQTLPIKQRELALNEIRTRAQTMMQAGRLEIERGNLAFNTTANTSGISDIVSQLRSAYTAPVAAPTFGSAPPAVAPQPGQVPTPAAFPRMPPEDMDPRATLAPKFGELTQARGLYDAAKSEPERSALAELLGGQSREIAGITGATPATAAPDNLDTRDIRAGVRPVIATTPAPLATPTAPSVKVPTLADAPAGLTPAAKQKWLLQQTKPSIAGNAPITPETATRIAQQALAGDMAALSGMARNQTALAQVQNEITRLGALEGVTGADIAGRRASNIANKGALTKVTTDLAAITPFKEMLDQNANIAIDLGKKIASDKTNSAFVNRPLLWVKNNLSDRPDIAEYLAQMHFVEVEAARVLTQPRLVGQLTDQAISDMKSVLSGNMTIASTEAVLKRIQQDGNNRINAMRKQHARTLAEISGTAPRTRASDANGVDTNNPLLR